MKHSHVTQKTYFIDTKNWLQISITKEIDKGTNFGLNCQKRIFITFHRSYVQSQAADLDENLNFVNFTFGFLSIKSNPIQWLIDYKVMAI